MRSPAEELIQIAPNSDQRVFQVDVEHLVCVTPVVGKAAIIGVIQIAAVEDNDVP